MSSDLIISSLLSDKVAVDLVQSIAVAKDHLRVKKKDKNLFFKFISVISGEDSARKNKIDENLLLSTEASLQLLNHLSESQAVSNYALVEVNKSLQSLTENVAQIANFSVDTREFLEQTVKEFNSRFDTLEKCLSKVDARGKADGQVGLVFSEWKSGKYESLALAERVYSVLEMFWWGEFGYFYREYADTTEKVKYKDRVCNELVVLLKESGQIHTSKQRIDSRIFLGKPEVQRNPLLDDGLAYLGDAANEALSPFVFSTTQEPEKLPLYMPRICSAERLNTAMFAEVFQNRESEGANA